jgi:acetyl-CoA carboxylase biotin carboxyl carrier protein
LSDAPEHDVERLIEIFEGSDLTTLRIVTPSLELHLSRGAADIPSPSPSPPPAPTTAVQPPLPAPPPAVAPAEPPAGDGHVVRAPMVGTVYRSPEPGAAPFVEIGHEVGADSTVCIVEAMKVFTAVVAGVAGVVEEIHVDTGDFVEFDQILLRIAPTSMNGASTV